MTTTATDNQKKISHALAELQNIVRANDVEGNHMEKITAAVEVSEESPTSIHSTSDEETENLSGKEKAGVSFVFGNLPDSPESTSSSLCGDDEDDDDDVTTIAGSTPYPRRTSTHFGTSPRNGHSPLSSSPKGSTGTSIFDLPYRKRSSNLVGSNSASFLGPRVAVSEDYDDLDEYWVSKHAKRIHDASGNSCGFSFEGPTVTPIYKGSSESHSAKMATRGGFTFGSPAPAAAASDLDPPTMLPASAFGISVVPNPEPSADNASVFGCTDNSSVFGTSSRTSSVFGALPDCPSTTSRFGFGGAPTAISRATFGYSTPRPSAFGPAKSAFTASGSSNSSGFVFGAFPAPAPSSPKVSFGSTPATTPTVSFTFGSGPTISISTKNPGALVAIKKKIAENKKQAVKVKVLKRSTKVDIHAGKMVAFVTDPVVKARGTSKVDTSLVVWIGVVSFLAGRLPLSLGLVVLIATTAFVADRHGRSMPSNK